MNIGLFDGSTSLLHGSFLLLREDLRLLIADNAHFKQSLSPFVVVDEKFECFPFKLVYPVASKADSRYIPLFYQNAGKRRPLVTEIIIPQRKTMYQVARLFHTLNQVIQLDIYAL